MAPSMQGLASRTSFWRLLLLLTATTTLPVARCASDPDFCLRHSTGLHPDPLDCRSYYSCAFTRTWHHRCPLNQRFNPRRNYCDWPDAVQCAPGGNKPTTYAPRTTRRRQRWTPTPRPQPFDAWFCRHRKAGIYADPSSCKHYIKCAGGRVAARVKCYPGTLFNPRWNYCDWQANVNCNSKQPDPTSPPATQPPATRPATVWTPATFPTTRRVINPSTGSACPRVVCYFTNWSQFRQGSAKFGAKDVDPYMCTHIIYAFAKLKGNQLSGTQWNDEESFRIITSHKNANPQLKVSLAVGGWNMGSAPFTAMVATRASRKEFVDSSIRFLRDRNFDGLDLDWEYPTKKGSPPIDKQRFVLLCQELKAAFEAEGLRTGRPRLILTAAVSAGKPTIQTAYDIRPLNAALDFINLMAYDFHGGWESTTGHNSPLSPGSWESGPALEYNVKSAVNVWLRGGADRNKLVVGLPLYGRSFRLRHPGNSRVGASASGTGSPGPHTNEAGYLSYYEVCAVRKTGAARNFIEEQRVPYLVSGDQWVGYDDRDSLRDKVRYIRDTGLGGAMVWDVSLDDFTGSFCGEGKNPLMNSILGACRN